MTDHPWFLYLNLILMGMFAVPIIPTTFAFAVELTYPMLPATANGLMMLCGQFFSFTISFIGSWMTEPIGDDVSVKRYYSILYIFFLSMCAVLSYIFTFFIKEELHRYNFMRE